MADSVEERMAHILAAAAKATAPKIVSPDPVKEELRDLLRAFHTNAELAGKLPSQPATLFEKWAPDRSWRALLEWRNCSERVVFSYHAWVGEQPTGYDYALGDDGRFYGQDSSRHEILDDFPNLRNVGALEDAAIKYFQSTESR